MQLSPLTDLFFASAPPAAAGPGSGLDPSTAPFAQWLSSQIKSAAPLADPSTPPPFSQFPLNWGFPTTSTLVAKAPAAPPGAEALLAGEVTAEALGALPKSATPSLAALAGGEAIPGVESATDSLQPKLPTPPAATPGTEAYRAGAVAAQALPAEVLASLPKPATSPLAALAGGEAKLGDHCATDSLQPILSNPPGPESGWPGPAPSGLEPESLGSVAPSSPPANPAVVDPRTRRGRALTEAPAAELAVAPPSPFASSTLAAPAVAPADISTAAAIVAEPSRPSAAVRMNAGIELPPVMAAPSPQAGAVQPAPISAAAAEPRLTGRGPQPVAPPASAAAQPRAEAQQVAVAIPQGRPAPAVPNSGIPLDPTLVAEASQAEIVATPAVAARPSQGANPAPQGMPWQAAQRPAGGLEPAPASVSDQAKASPMPPAQPGWVRPAETPVRAPLTEPAQAAAVQGGAPKLVPVTPEASLLASMASGATPQSLAAAAHLAAGQIAPVAVAPPPTAGFGPSPAWADAGSLEANPTLAGMTAAAETGFNPTMSRPVAAAAAGQQPGERSLSDQRFASLFNQVSPQGQVQQADAPIPQQAAVAPAAGFESLLQPSRETTGTLAQPELTAPPLVTAPLGQPTAAVASTPPAGPLLTLPSGQQVPEQEVLQQVFHQLPSRASGPQRVILRLNPEELGEVRLEMIIDKETVRAHLQAQSQQVQEVLEKHLPRLREAFEQQGLKLQELQVSVDSGRDGGRSFFSQSQHQQPAPSFAGSGNARRPQGEAVTEAVVPPPAPRSSGGLSLRV